MSTCIDTGNIDDERSSSWKPTWNGMYVKTIIDPCLDCIHMPYGKNKECKLTTTEQIYCKINGHCFRKKNPNVALYVNVTQKDDFIEEKEFEV